MKTPQSIISQLSQRYQFRPLGKYRCYKQYISMLPPRFQDAIAFVYTKNNTLHLALSHPGYKMELRHHTQMLLEILDSMLSYDDGCHFMKAQKVVLFHSKYAPSQHHTECNTIPRYSELSSGHFKVNIENKELKKRFEEIRALILGE